MGIKAKLNKSNSKTILCYGDSNTWGFVPGSLNIETFYMERYPFSKRWTGLLQLQLGNDYYIAESGLCGRTTNIDSKVNPNVNGKSQLYATLFSHAPVDLVILMLGTNDLKVEFNRDAEQISNGIAQLIEMIQASTFGCNMQRSPEILLICPPCPVHENSYYGQFEGAIKRYQGLPEKYAKVAQNYNAGFYDANAKIEMSAVDGIHFDENVHQQFAESIIKYLI